VPTAVPALVQILQTENDAIRLLLIDLLAKIEGREASRALAARAIFDTSTDVRKAAISVLRRKIRSEFRDVLLDGLRYPWPDAADAAATALVALEDRPAVPTLVRLLDEPNPAAPFAVNEGYSQSHFVREVVRINHNRNCILCHAASFQEDQPVRAAMPDPKLPLPPPFSPAYYHQTPDNRLFVRADVTYLRQDFSVPQHVDISDSTGRVQRFDFCVRTRRLSVDEWLCLSEMPIDYPQREAVLFALRELSGEDRGTESSAWRTVAARFEN
jgi:hypothetical protein